MKNNIMQFSVCANCGACYNICPVNAIRLKDDNYFYSISVDESKCIECGKCTKVCPVNKPEKRNNILSAIGGYSIDPDIVKRSSSGGAFSVLAHYILDNNGVVFGAAYDNDCRSVLIKNTEEISLNEILKSKYVESLVGESFKKVKDFLIRDRLVLYCGCPCQIAGLKRYLGLDYDNLITCDFSCGGLPSHKIYNDYLDSLENRYNSKVNFVDFRPKTNGWNTHSIKIKFNNRKEYNSLAQLDPYFCCFIYKHYTVRDNCLNCSFSDNHYADLILADFWKHEELSHMKCGNGLSLILSNSQKGEIFLNIIKEKMKYEQLDKEKASYNIRPTSCGKEFLDVREEFFNSYQKNGVKTLNSVVPTGKTVLEIKIKSHIKNFLNNAGIK